MTRNAKLRAIIEISTAGLMLLTLATAVARRPGRPSAGVADQTVILSLVTGKYHCAACDHARRCGAECETIDVAEAVRRGAKPCPVCGGVCLTRK